MIGTAHAMPARATARLTAALNDAQADSRRRIATLADYVRATAGDGGEPLPEWRGEMRSGARANVLMGVTSLRRDAKAACGRAERLVERYAEPLAALYLPPDATTAAHRLVDLAWDRLVMNAAHDSACNCSADEVVAQVVVRHHEAAQLAGAVTGQALAALAAGVPPVDHVVVNPSPSPRADVVELDLVVPAAWEGVALRTGSGDVLGTQELERNAPILLTETLRGADAVKIFDRMFGRQLFGRNLNRVEAAVVGGTHRLVYEVDTHPDPAALDADEVRAEVETAVAVAPDEDWEVRIVGRARRRVLAKVPAGPLGGTVVSPVSGGGPLPDVVSVDGDRLVGDLLAVAAEPDGTLSLSGPGRTLRGVGRIVDVGDAGDSYNWAPVATDTAVDEPASVGVRVVETGPLRAALITERTYRWPLALADGLGRRSDETADVTVTTTAELRAGEPFARIRVAFDNPSADHRVRWHVPLPAPVDRSWAEGQFAVVERGLTAQGGHGEYPLPTFPARGFVAVDGVAVLLDHLTEYEVVDDGAELALTLLRSTGMISRNVHPLRTEPAGPEIAIPAAQMIGPQVVTFALLPFAGGWQEAGVLAAMERYQHPFVTTPGQGGAAPAVAPAAAGGLRVDGDNVVVSALRRRDGRLELRLVCEQDAPAVCTVSGGLTAARDVDLLGRPGADLPVDDGTLRLELGPWEIRTLQLRRGDG